ncbi:MAG: hypothetical protein JRC77_08315 [Deltaproteobacteria bacterium]|nr:hypothetical protein [Deltaproteobacteria bacterium]
MSQLEARFEKMQHAQHMTYRDVTMQRPTIPISIALTNGRAEEFTQSELGKQLEPCIDDRTFLQAEHLEIMQLPEVVNTAAWLDQLVLRIGKNEN